MFRISSRSRKQYSSGVQAPMSRPKVPMAIRWLAMRCSSAQMTRMCSARSGTWTPSIRSTATA